MKQVPTKTKSMQSDDIPLRTSAPVLVRSRILAKLGMALALFVIIASPFLGIPGWTPAVGVAVAFVATTLIGLNLIFGLTGMLALGQATFAAIPGYVVGMLWLRGWPLPLAMTVSLILTVTLARLLAILFVRLPGMYFAIGTLGFAYVVEGIARAFPGTTGGASGLVFPGFFVLFGFQFRETAHWYLFGVTVLLVALLTYRKFVDPRRQRVLRLIRRDELAAEVLGIDVVRTKARVFTVGCAYTAVGGLMTALYVGVVVPETAGVNASLGQLSMLMLGGAGFVTGPVFGAGLLQWVFQFVSQFARWQLAVYGAVFLGVVIYAPRGVAGGVTTLVQRIRDRSPAVRALPAPAPLVDRETVESRLARRWKLGQSGDICLDVRSVTKRFTGVVAVDEATLTCHYGEILCLIGPNGAGKSTLFNVISGVEPVSSGHVHLGGQAINDMSIHARARLGVGRSFQVARLVDELTVLQNVMLGFEIVGREFDEKELPGLAMAELQRFGLDGAAMLPAGTLGTGQRKLVELVRAAICQPALLLLDEPAVGLTDTELDELERLLLSFRERGSAVLLVEHNVDFVARVADHVVAMDAGRVIGEGSASEIRANDEVQRAYYGAL